MEGYCHGQCLLAAPPPSRLNVKGERGDYPFPPIFAAAPGARPLESSAEARPDPTITGLANASTCLPAAAPGANAAPRGTAPLTNELSTAAQSRAPFSDACVGSHQ